MECVKNQASATVKKTETQIPKNLADVVYCDNQNISMSLSLELLRHVLYMLYFHVGHVAPYVYAAD